MIIFSTIAAKKIANLAAEKEWGKGYYSPNEILDILLNRSIDFEKIEKALLETKQKKDPRYINIITCRKIGKTEKKCSKFYFHDKYRLCCPKDNEELWDVALEKFQEDETEESTSEYSDHFDWASDEDSQVEEFWDYIVPIKPIENKLKNLLKHQ
jgi:hypothetical protein